MPDTITAAERSAIDAYVARYGVTTVDKDLVSDFDVTPGSWSVKSAAVRARPRLTESVLAEMVATYRKADWWDE